VFGGRGHRGAVRLGEPRLDGVALVHETVERNDLWRTCDIMSYMKSHLDSRTGKGVREGMYRLADDGHGDGAHKLLGHLLWHP
jgi:hypothetical protein